MKNVTIAPSTKEFPRKSEGDVIELKDGRLLVVYMEFTGDGSDLAHTRIVGQESADSGLTWRGHRVIIETIPGDMNVYSPNLVRANDGGILLAFMRQKSVVPRVTTHYVWKSTDEGRTFAPFAEHAAGKDYSLCNAVIKRLPSGRLLLPVSAIAKAGTNPYGHIYCGTVHFSDDDGLTWQEAANRLVLPMRGIMEPHVEATRDGRVLMVMRTQLGALFQSESKDDGTTWSKPQTTGLQSPESCPELARIPDTGDLLLIWNNRPYDPQMSHYGRRTPLSAVVSRDDGKTWGNSHDIECDPDHAFSNPGCRFTKAGLAVVNYWTCEYLPDNNFRHMLSLRVAMIETNWFYQGVS